MPKIRAYKIAEELGIERNESAEYFRSLGFDVKSAMAALDEEQVTFIRRMYNTRTPVFSLADEFGMIRSGLVGYLRSLGYEAADSMTSFDQDQVREIRYLFYSGATKAAAPVGETPSPAEEALKEVVELPGSNSPNVKSLGGADSLPLCLSEPNIAKQVVALGTLLEALLKEVLVSRKQDVNDAKFLLLIDLGFDSPPKELFQSVRRASLHDARKARNGKLHARIGRESPNEDDYRRARNVFLLGVNDLLPQLSSELAQAVLFSRQ